LQALFNFARKYLILIIRKTFAIKKFRKNKC
jgi:hypothetical protein